MLAKRIVPCLDIKDGKTVKGINFVNFRDAGDPVELGAQYSREGADELVYLDITASHEGRKTFTELVEPPVSVVALSRCLQNRDIRCISLIRHPRRWNWRKERCRKEGFLGYRLCRRYCRGTDAAGFCRLCLIHRRSD